MPPGQKWSDWPIPSPRRPRYPDSASSSAVSSPNPSFIGSEPSENGEIVGNVAESASLQFAAPTFRFAWWRRHKSQEQSGKENPRFRLGHLKRFSLREENPRFRLGHLKRFSLREENQQFRLGHLKRFSLRELQAATNNFSYKNMLELGSTVYKGRLADGSLVMVKMLTWKTPGEDLQFQSEVELISMAVHPNLLRILGFCMTPKGKFLVYPFMANGSVASRLRERPPTEAPLDWPNRRRIALGSARGLSYLHDHCDPKIIYRDVKAANILLDEEFEAVVGHFGLAILMDYKDTHVTTSVCGTSGHIAPEYLTTGKCSEKTDVFGYGIMLLELITGQRAFDLARLANDDDVMLLDWVKYYLKEKRLEMMVDPDLTNYIEAEMESLIQVALLCSQDSPMDRPKMSEVVRMLEGDGLAERWEEWQKVEVIRQELERQESIFDSTFSCRRIIWPEVTCPICQG